MGSWLGLANASTDPPTHPHEKKTFPWGKTELTTGVSPRIQHPPPDTQLLPHHFSSPAVKVCRHWHAAPLHLVLDRPMPK